MHDVHAVIGELSESGSFIGHVNQLLASCPIEVLNLVKQSILQAVEPLKELLPSIMNVMIGIIVKKSNEVSRSQHHLMVRDTICMFLVVRDHHFFQTRYKGFGLLLFCH